MQRLLERLLVRDFARHQKAERFLDAGVVGHVDEALVDDLRARLGGDVRAQVAVGSPIVSMYAAVHGTPAEFVSAGPPP